MLWQLLHHQQHKTDQYTNPPYISFHIKDMYRVELCTKLFYPTLFPCFLLICYSYILTLYYVIVCCIECFHGDASSFQVMHHNSVLVEVPQ